MTQGITRTPSLKVPTVVHTLFSREIKIQVPWYFFTMPPKKVTVLKKKKILIENYKTQKPLGEIFVWTH